MKKATKAELKAEIVRLRLGIEIRHALIGNCPFATAPIEGHCKEECDKYTCAEHKKLWVKLKKAEIIKEVEAM